MEKEMRQVFADLREKRENPFYLFDGDALKATINHMRELSSENMHLCYAMKANPFMVGVAAEVADRIEVCSFGEYRICRHLNIPNEKLLISGVLKKAGDLQDILDEVGGEVKYTAESPLQFKQIGCWAKANKVHVDIYPRLTSGNQFGMDFETIKELIEWASDNEYLHIAGIHYFSGTQKRKPKINRKELTKLDALLQEVGARELEYGPGIPVAYFEDQEVPGVDEYFAEIRDTLEEMTWKGQVTLEMGRAMAATCGYYATKICDLKISGDKRYCLVDGGMHQLNYDGQIRGMYQPMMTVIRDKDPEQEVVDDSSWLADMEKLVKADQSKAEADNAENSDNESTSTEPAPWTICGSLCTGNDILVMASNLRDPELGDMLVFENAGAYCFYEGMTLFLSHELTDIMIYSKQDGIRMIREDVQGWKLNTISHTNHRL